ncbi:MAG: ABC transporter permease [Coriobacteriia bacterium]|nr:ABC transporter permease [Coriobacteriia bacterium]
MMRALAAEFRKLKRARMILWTALVVIGYTSIGLAMLPVFEDLQASGALTPEAQSMVAPMEDPYEQANITEVNWDAAMKFVPMGVSGAWGIMLLSLVAAYVFGRELREGTDAASATLPVRREYTVVAKLVVIAAWTAGLALLAVLVDVPVVGVYLGFETFKWEYFMRGAAETLYASLFIYLTLPLIGWLSLIRKGYLRPMLFALAAFSVSMSLIGLEAAAYVPWSMPSVAVGVSWMPLRGELTAMSWAIALAVFGLGLAALIRRTNRLGDAG